MRKCAAVAGEQEESESDRETGTILSREEQLESMNSRREILLELQHTKMDLDRTREESMQSWLDSRPIIDQLEHLKSTLAASNGRISMANSLISDLNSNLESTHLEIQAKKAQQIKTHEIISQLNQDIVQKRHELEQIKLETDEKRMEKPKLTQTLGVKKQSLDALQKKLRAVKMESRGLEASIGFIDRVDVDDSGTVRISLRDYHELLRKRANEEGSFANWRVVMFEEQRGVAEANIEKAMMRLKEIEDEEKGLPERDDKGAGFDVVFSPRIMERSRKKEKKKKKKKKKSMLVRIKISLVKKLKKWFG